MSEEEDENLLHNEKQKKQLLVFSKKIEEIISEYQNRKKFGIPKIKEDNLQKVDLKQYNEFYEKMEEQKNMANAYKQKLNNDEKFDEITKKEDELKNLKQEFQEIEKEYQLGFLKIFLLFFIIFQKEFTCFFYIFFFINQ